MKIRWKFLTLPVLWTAFVSSAAADAKLPPDARADRMIVLKSQRELHLMRNGALLKSYKISLGGNPVGPKQRQGDSRTPEGLYTISGRNSSSRFHLSLRISYPTAEQSERAREGGYNPGGDIFIHGLPNGWGAIGKGHLLKDWTDRLHRSNRSGNRRDMARSPERNSRRDTALRIFKRADRRRSS